MKTATGYKVGTLSRLKLFCALSRTPHGLLDMATPGVCALLWLGSPPPFGKITLGVLTAFSGYTAVYALNDIVDYRVDREKMRDLGLRSSGSDLDAVFVRHPLAQGFLTRREGTVWMGGWALLALIGAYLLNPVCAAIFLGAAFLETVYCLLLKISHLRVFMSGVVKTSGGVAAVFAVDPSPSPFFLLVLFFWLFFWEIGGQNIPNDWMDLEEDLELKAKTVPVWLGPRSSLRAITLSLAVTVVLSLALCWVVPWPKGWLFPAGVSLGGFILLILPARRLWQAQSPGRAAELFNRASYYPLVMLLVTIFSWTMK